MNNLINMSDHEKVIFVTGIDESNIESIRSLSAAYPFAVFFTNNSDIEEPELPIMNIWKGGIRLTRFIGVDNDNNTIQIGDHSVKLLFDYETGRIGLYDANKLDDIALVNILYRDIQGSIVSQPIINSIPITVNAIDNKFVLTLTFKSNIDGSAAEISNSLNVEPATDFTLNEKSHDGDEIINGDGSTSINNKYTYQIVKDTYKEVNPKTYSLVSAYSSDKSVDANLSLVLNPEKMNIYLNGAWVGSNSINIEYGVNSRIDVSLLPAVESYDGRKLYVKLNKFGDTNIKFKNEQNIIVDDDVAIREVDPLGQVTFNIEAQNNSIYDDGSHRLKFEVYCIIENNTMYYGAQDLNVTKNVIISGHSGTAFWYAGYDDPTSTEFDISNLIQFDDSNAGIDILYDWNDPDKNLGLVDDNTKWFYIAIPLNDSAIIKPRWDAYTIDDHGNKIYVDYTSGFDVLRSSYQINGVKFIIYKSTFKGKLYGKIQ